MVAPRRILTSLPSDVLHEILKHLLLDTPRAPRRAATLRTCSLLHDLGIPLLYRVVDLAGYGYSYKPVKHWKSLFGQDGLLVKKEGRGSFVLELRMGAERLLERAQESEGFNFHVAELFLPNCSSLLLSLTGPHEPNYPPFALIISQLPVKTLILFSHHDPILSGLKPAFRGCAGEDKLIQPWTSLERVVCRGGGVIPRMKLLWQDPMRGSTTVLSILLWNWSFKTFVVELDLSSAFAALYTAKDVFDLFIHPFSKHEGDGFLRDVERIELRVTGGWRGEEFEQKVKEEAKKRGAVRLSLLEKRLLPLFVLVSEEGKETRLEGIE